MKKESRKGFGVLCKEKELWLLVFIGILYFHRPLFMGETFFFRDLSLLFLPKQHFLIDAINAREFPLWSPFMYGGLPYFADISQSTLSPATLLFLILPFIKAFNLTIILHIQLGAVFAYLFARTLGLRPVASLIVGVMYGFCGYMLSLVNLLAALLNMPYVPLLFLLWHLFLLERQRKWFVLSILTGVFQAFSGSPEINIITMLSLLGWTLCYSYPQRTALRKILLWVLLGIFIVGIALIQIIPTAELLYQSPRQHGIRYTEFSGFSLHPKQLPEFILPGFLGYIDKLPGEVHYWGGNLVDERNPLILSIYFGGVALSFMLIGGFSKKDRVRGVPFPVRLFFLLVFLGSLFLTFGRFLPFFQAFYQYIPLITIFRYPIKSLIAGLLPFALLVGYTSDIHFGNPSSGASNNQEHPGASPSRTPSSKMLLFFWGITALFCIATAIFWSSQEFTDRLQELFFGQSGNDIASHGLRTSLLHSSIIWLLVTLLYQYRRLQKRAWQHWLLAGVLILDVFIAGKRVNPTAPAEFFTKEPPLAQRIHQEIGDGKMFRTEDSGDVMIPLLNKTPQIPPDSVVWAHLWKLNILSDQVGALYNIPVIFHQDSNRFAQKHIATLQSHLQKLPWKHKLPFLSAAGVTLILTQEDFSLPGVERIETISNWGNIPLFLYKNTTAAPPAEFVSHCITVRSDVEALNTMIAPDYEPRETVILHPTKAQRARSLLGLKQTPIDLSNCSEFQQFQTSQTTTPTHDARVIRNRLSFHSAEFSVETSCNGYLVFPESFYPGWHAQVDGKPTPILRANFAFSAISLPAGTHNVKRYYFPRSLFFGIVGSACFGILLWIITYKRWLL